MLSVLHNLQESEAKGDPIRALILRSTIPKVFCAGANLKERQLMTRAQVESWLKVQRSLMDSVSDFLYPTIAAIDGHALGGGLELALACDMRIINEKARVGLVETRLAIIPGAGGTQRLARLIGVGKAKEHIFVAEPVDGIEAYRLGIANHVVAGEDASYTKAIEIAQKICKRGPKALRLAKAAIDNGSQASLDTGLDIENAYYGQLLDSSDRSEGMKAFNEKRDPLYTGN
jgi:methylglutaconyl-CoA hydratase